MNDDKSGVIEVVSAYGAVLSRAAYAMVYLLYLSASILAGWLSGLGFTLLGPQALSFVIMFGAFALLLPLASYSSSILFRIESAHRLANLPPDRREQYTRVEKRLRSAMSILWSTSFGAGILLSFGLAPTSLRVPLAVSISLGLANILMFIALASIVGQREYRVLLGGLYLLATLPTYFMILGSASAGLLGFVLLTIHTSVSSLGIALSYMLSARHAALGILHAARGAD